MNRDDIATTLRLYLLPRECVRCGTQYCELENLGQWHCRYHPGLLASPYDALARTPAHHYTCCRAGERAPGCTRIDHIAEPSTAFTALGRFSAEEAAALFADRPELAAARRGVEPDASTGDVFFRRVEPRRRRH